MPRPSPAPTRPRSATLTSCVIKTVSCSARTSRSSPTTMIWSASGRGSARSATTSAGRSSMTMRSTSSRWTELALRTLPPTAVAVLRAVQRAGGPAAGLVLVGGAVRDAFLGRPVADLDVALPTGALALADKVAVALGATAVVLDADRGAARVAAPGLQLDINDFRAADLAGDLAARDFTVNALAVPLGPLLLTGRARVVDPTGGCGRPGPVSSPPTRYVRSAPCGWRPRWGSR